MKKVLGIVLLLAIVLGLTAMAGAEATDPAPEASEAEWTVLFYFCGSDLESKYSYATENLQEILSIEFPDLLAPWSGGQSEEELYQLSRQYDGKVNVLIETGGSSAWEIDPNQMDITIDALQRWQYFCYSAFDPNHQEIFSEMKLLETCPLASMGKSETLTDFIRWGVQTCPAKKYALVLWDHGGGSLTGLFIDELFDSDVLYLYELKQALADAGATFEAVIVDACMMASIETVGAVKDNARWMVASEELVPGKGTAVKDWLQELYYNPTCDGKVLGRLICDTTMARYAQDKNVQFRANLTWSVIDLSQADRLVETADRFFRQMGATLANAPELSITYAALINKSEEYGDGKQYMRDFAGMLYGDLMPFWEGRDIRNELIDALADAVVYSVRGSGRSGAQGLSFCYPAKCSVEELELYAKNCPCPSYLAFLDAVTDWTAPDSVYEKTERLPPINTIDELQLKLKQERMADGLPALVFETGISNTYDIYYYLYRLDEDSDQIVCLGKTDCFHTETEDMKDIVYANEPWIWPTIDDIPCSMDLLLKQYRSGEEERLYNIPVQIGTTNYFLRCGRVDTFEPGQLKAKHGYEIYGVWDGYNSTSSIINRNVTRLSSMPEKEYRLLWPLESTNSQDPVRYMPAGPLLRISKVLDIAEKPLPAGTYYLQYEVNDMFLRPYLLPRIEFHWDGKNITFPEDLKWDSLIDLTKKE